MTPIQSLPHRPKIEPINRQQLLLRAVDIEELVPEDDPVRAIWELTGRLDRKRVTNPSSHAPAAVMDWKGGRSYTGIRGSATPESRRN
jgi:hypothetical protein